MKYESVIFDLDGTLLDTLLDLAYCMNAVLEQNGLPTRPIENYKYYVGEGMDMLIRNVTQGMEGVNEDKIKALFTGMREVYGNNWDVYTQPYEGINELLDKLLEKDLELNVLSNKPHEFTVKMVMHYFPGVPFSKVLGAREEKHKKPHPESALEIASSLNIIPGEIIFLGDTKIDMQTAVNAGNFPVGVLWGFRTAEELSSHGARLLISKPEELLSVL